VVLAFNEFRGEGVSSRYPSIVQDAIVIGGFIIIAVALAPRELLTPSAVGALIVGLALQDTLGNLFSGLALQVEKPILVGNWVKVAQIEGKVSEVTWRATKIRTKEGHICVIPNTMIARDTIINYSHPSPVIRREITIGFGYEAPPNKVKQCVIDTLADVPDVLRKPPPTLILENYNDFSVDYRIRFWIKEFGRCERILDEFTSLLYYKMKREGLSIPYPIQDLRLSNTPKVADVEALELTRKKHFVDRVDLFAGLEESDRTMIAECLEEATFAEDESIVTQGDSGDSMFFIRNGSVKVMLEKYGQTKEVAQIGPGNYFGEMALLTGESRTATVAAKTDVDVFVLRKEPFSEVLLSNSDMANSIAGKVSKRKASLESNLMGFSDVTEAPKVAQASMLRKIQAFFTATHKPEL
jgi:CRP-like cAMP-binding protein